MKINILLPYKEKFDEKKASSVSITVKNNLNHSIFLKNIKIYGQQVERPIFKDNFVGIKYPILSLKGKNNFLADKMLKIILESPEKKQLIEIHNRPYLVDRIARANNFPLSLFLHNDPQTMKGSRSIKERENILDKCTAVFCVSQYVKNQFIEGLYINLHKVFVLYNGVDRKLTKFPFKKKEVLFVGRLVPEKDFDLYVDLIKSIASKYPDWIFNLIGSFKLGEIDSINSYVSKVSRKFETIGPQAKFYGFKDQNFVQDKMKDSSIIIIPSLWQEPFGMVVAEAMSNGIAIIASKVGGIPEIVKENGILIEGINAEKLKASLIELLENKEKRILFQKKSWNNFKLSSIKSSKKLDRFRHKIFTNSF